MNNKNTRLNSKYLLSGANLSQRRGFNMHRTAHGFTLIELIVTLGIIALLFVAMVPVLHSYDMKNRLKYVADQYQSMLVETRNYALAPRAGDTGAIRYVVRLTHKPNKEITTIEKGYYDKDDNFISIGGSRNMPAGIREDSWCPSYTDSETQPTTHSIDFSIPDASVRFDKLFDSHSKMENTACEVRTGVFVPGKWRGDTSGNGVIKLIQDGVACSTPKVTCQVIKVNSNSGQVSLESETTPSP